MKLQNRFVGITLIIILFATLGVLRLNDLCLYNESVYNVLWGTAFIQGKGFLDETQPLPAPTAVEAPLYPLILAPMLGIFPYSLTVTKILSLLFGCCALLLMYFLLQQRVQEWVAISITALFAVSPMTLLFATEALPEFLFVCVVLFVFYRATNFFENITSQKTRLLLLILVSLSPLLHIGGYALVCSAFLILFYENRKYDAVTVLLTTIVFVGVLYVRNLSLPQASVPIGLSFFEHRFTSGDTPLVVELWKRALHNGSAYLLHGAGLLLVAPPMHLLLDPSMLTQTLASFFHKNSHYLLLIFAPILIIGLIEDWKSTIGKLRILFAITYSSIVLFAPSYDIRYIFPLFPFLLFFMAVGFYQLHNTLQKKQIVLSLVIVLLLLVLVPNALATAELVRSNILYTSNPDTLQIRKTSYESFTYYSTPWKRVGEWFTTNVPEGAIVVTPSKELALFASHVKILLLQRTVPVPQFESAIRKHQADYIVTPFVIEGVPEYCIQMTEGVRCSYELVAMKSHVGIYKIHYKNLSTTTYPALPQKGVTDTLYRSLRAAIHHEQYDSALTILQRLKKHYPHAADLQFQKLLIDVFSLRDSAANTDLHVLSTLPHASPYLILATSFLETLKSFKNSKEMKNPVAASDELFRISQFYWNTGYPIQAERMLQEALRVDSANFIGLLWALHYSIENGAPKLAYLKTLTALEPTNILVQAFHRIIRVRDSLARAQSPIERSRIDSTLADIYQTIGLPDEALDYAERSVAQDPLNSVRWYFLGLLYEKQGAPIAAYKLYKKVLEIDSTYTQAQLSLYRIKKGIVP